MPDIAQILKAEIRRIARAEIRTAMGGVNEQVKKLKNTVRKLRENIAVLEETQARAKRAPAIADNKESTEQAIRMSAASIRRHRLRLQLSQRELAVWLGVSMNTIVRWEQGTSKPRDTHRKALAQMRKEGVRSMRAKLGD